MGGEGTGYAFMPQQAMLVEGSPLRTIDHEPNAQAPRWLAGRRVIVNGAIEWHAGIERGIYPVLVATAIQPVRYFGPVPLPPSR